MNCSPTLTAEEFKVLHNSLCELDGIDHPRVHELVERIREVALKGAYEQDEDAFDEKYRHYDNARDFFGFASIWSMYEIEDLDARHPYPSDVFVVYQGQHCAVTGPNWTDIWRAADVCIENSGDDHHIFIEGFTLKNGNQLHLATGS